MKKLFMICAAGSKFNRLKKFEKICEWDIFPKKIKELFVFVIILIYKNYFGLRPL